VVDDASGAERGPAGWLSLGLNAAEGFGSGDQTSPARAGAAHALIDVELDRQPVTEVRIHGVAGCDGPTMLEHPTTLQVGGDRVAGFFRRWSPDGQGRASVPWKLEAYSWGGLTERPLASASWLLLAPFMMYNLAHFMLLAPRQAAGGRPGSAAHDGPGGSGQSGPARVASWTAQALLRLLALCATVQLTMGAATVMISTVGWQAGRKSLLPVWLGWYTDLPTGWRCAIALAAVAAVVGGLWLISVTTASRYEARTTTVRPEPDNPWPLARPGFWHGQVLVRRQRSIHVAAAWAATALIVALPAESNSGARTAAILVAALVLAVAVGLLISPLADWHQLESRATSAGQDSRPGRPDLTCRLVLAGGGAAVLLSGLVAGFGDHRPHSRTGPLPGLTGFALSLLGCQLLLLVALGITVAAIAVRNRPSGGPAFRPYLGGGLAALFATLAFCLGSLLTAVVSIGVARLLGSPVPGGFRFSSAPVNPLEVPWPVYASAAGAIGLAAGVIVALLIVLGYFMLVRRRFLNAGPVAENSVAKNSPAANSAISIDQAYQGRGAEVVNDKGRGKLASLWAIGALADGLGAPAVTLVGCWLAALVAAEVIAYHFAGTTAAPHLLRESGWLHGTFSAVAAVGVLTAAAFIIVLRRDYSSASDRRTVGALWDVATFWPRATHPLAPPCYAERAVPEVVDRIRLITGSHRLDQDDPVWALRAAERPDLASLPGLTLPTGPVLLTGYSQGSMIAIAVIAQLPSEVTDELALLTLACPARRLYGRSFPAYFGYDQLGQLSRLLDKPRGSGAVREPGFRWRNVVRRSDFIGGWVFDDPLEAMIGPRYDAANWLAERIDQVCWDPVVLVSAADPTPPPAHQHFAWWQDPRCGQVGEFLVDRLSAMTLPFLNDNAAGGDAGRAARHPRIRRYRGRGAAAH
jgi:hypothetical protein